MHAFFVKIRNRDAIYYCKQIILFNLKQILSVKLEIKDNLKI